MPTPVPTPTSAEKAKLRPILELETHAEVLALVSDFDTQAEADAEWALTLADLTRLGSLNTGRSNIKKILDVVEFFEGGSGADRLEAINDIRIRYGLEPLSTLVQSDEIVSTGAYF